jgi:hypothetical protein
VTVIDICDAAKVLGHTWYASKDARTWYAKTALPRGGGLRGTLALHRLILEPPPHMQVDHIDGDGLNNRRSNLRLATRVQNCRNSRRPSNNTSGWKGVVWDKRKRKWQAHIGLNGRMRFLGYFHSEEQAARAYDQAAVKFYGAFARVNFAQGELFPRSARGEHHLSHVRRFN